MALFGNRAGGVEQGIRFDGGWYGREWVAGAGASGLEGVTAVVALQAMADASKAQPCGEVALGKCQR